jgi:hypothetical protein
MKKKDYIYCSVILLILVSSSITINNILANQDKNCWNMLKEISESKEI